MNDINVLIEELRKLVATSELPAPERFQVAMNRMAGFLAEAFGGEKAEVAILWKRGKSLSFLWPDFLVGAKKLAIDSKMSVATNILRSGCSFLDNQLIEREHMVEYEFVKEAGRRLAPDLENDGRRRHGRRRAAGRGADLAQAQRLQRTGARFHARRSRAAGEADRPSGTLHEGGHPLLKRFVIRE